MAARKKTAKKKKATTSKKGGRKKAARKAAAPRKKAGRKKAGRKKAGQKKTGRKKVGRKKAARKKAARKRDATTVALIAKTAGDVHRVILKKQKPDLLFPVRSLGNVTYSNKKGYFQIGKQKKVRTLTVNTVKSFAQTLRMMGLSKELVETNDFATKRDAYYQSKNWESAKFDEQSESDTVMDDIEAMFSVKSVSREQLSFIPDEHVMRS